MWEMFLNGVAFLYLAWGVLVGLIILMGLIREKILLFTIWVFIGVWILAILLGGLHSGQPLLPNWVLPVYIIISGIWYEISKDNVRGE